ncbi:MAG: hypothetical protein LC104_00970 [Bacteroidales bacterium]|nr:hypothetical protein [Bacteroidales bacterium]
MSLSLGPVAKPEESIYQGEGGWEPANKGELTHGEVLGTPLMVMRARSIIGRLLKKSRVLLTDVVLIMPKIRMMTTAFRLVNFRCVLFSDSV